MRDKARSPMLTRAPASRVSSTVLPRQGAWPDFRSAVAGKEEDQLPHLP